MSVVGLRWSMKLDGGPYRANNCYMALILLASRYCYMTLMYNYGTEFFPVRNFHDNHGVRYKDLYWKLEC